MKSAWNGTWRCAFACLGLLCARSQAQAPSTVPPEGLRENTPAVHALVGARIVVGPGEVLERETIVVRDGVITAVGKDVVVPAEARRWDVAGKVVYPGLIDPYSELSEAQGGSRAGAGGSGTGTGAGPSATGGAELLRTASGGAAHWNARVTPQLRMDEQYRGEAEANKKLRSQGVVARLIAPSRNIIKGSSAAVSTGDAEGRRTILRPVVAIHLQLMPSGSFGSERGYPSSPMGAVALVRQAMLDAQWYARAWAAYQGDPSLARPEKNDALEAIADVVAGKTAVMIDAGDEQYAMRADRVAREFGLNAILRGSGQEYRRVTEIAGTGRAIIVPVNFSRAPNVASPEGAMGYSLEELMDWDLQPENPARLEKAGVKFALTSHGLRDKGTYLASVRKAVARGLSKEGALKAMTTIPAEMLGIERSHGTIAARKAANLVVTDGDLFETRTKILETWVDGVRHEIVPSQKEEVRGTWAMDIEGLKPLSVKLGGEPARLRGNLPGVAAATRPAGRGARGGRDGQELANVALSASQVSFTFKADSLGLTGVVQVSATVSGDSWLGVAVKPDGTAAAVTARRTAAYVPSPDEARDQEGDSPVGPTTRPVEAVAAAPTEKATLPGERERPTTQTVTPQVASTQPASGALARAAESASTQPSLFDVNYPLGAFGRTTRPEQPAVVLFRNATVWTSGPRGKLTNASVLVERGKIAGVFAKNEESPRLAEGAVVVDCTGMHLSPGIIDCHSHIATDGGINEGSRSITCQVRIGDFIDATDISIYRQLAGGVTAANVLHGSANTIGGQNQVIKLRWGASDEELKFKEAPPGVKFALGENVKRSGSETSTRYPKTRMGVEQVVKDAFSAAADYRRAWDQYNATKKGIPPRVDLELEALSEIVSGKRWIHCHSYRQDEILAFLRICEQFGVKVATLQHVLEGYKVADAIARHGAGGSTFSDWWAYKFEVYDAIPYNGSLMRDAGVVVSFNSDDAELARRLNLEAAKAVKYGGVPEEEALKFVTLNPARQLRIDNYVGSIEPGKQADLAVWSGSPLSTLGRCEQTWIDGRRYFDRGEDQEMRKTNARMRSALVQKILGGTEAMADAGEADAPRPRDLWVHDQSCSACECGVHASR